MRPAGPAPPGPEGSAMAATGEPNVRSICGRHGGEAAAPAEGPRRCCTCLPAARTEPVGTGAASLDRLGTGRGRVLATARIAFTGESRPLPTHPALLSSSCRHRLRRRLGAPSTQAGVRRRRRGEAPCGWPCRASAPRELNCVPGGAPVAAFDATHMPAPPSSRATTPRRAGAVEGAVEPACRAYGISFYLRQFCR